MLVISMTLVLSTASLITDSGSWQHILSVQLFQKRCFHCIRYFILAQSKLEIIASVGDAIVYQHLASGL